ncbi:DNA recombination protein RmuC [Mucilaginibacter koreensis]
MGMIAIIVAVVILAIAVVLFIKKPQATVGVISAEEFESLKVANEQLKISLAIAEEKCRGLVTEKDNIVTLLQQDIEKLNGELVDERLELAEANRNLQRAQSFNEAQQQKFTEQKEELAQTRLHLQREFENVAEKLLKEKSREFTDVNKTHLDHILTPLKENIKAFEEKVDKVYNMEAAERNTLKGVITQLMELNNQISNEAKNLTTALKGDNKKQGNWGEFILEKVLERSGLVKDREYRLQANYQSHDGNRYFPDAVIDLPDNKHLIIDSKVSLIAYDRLVNCESEEERKLHAKAHVESLRGHVHNLSAKNYHDLKQINSPDFVLLFVPIESSFSFAVQIDADLFNDAWDKRVVIVSPSTLLATLRTIASMWKQERQNRNVMEIARLSGEMYDKFVGFLGDMDSLSKNLRTSQDAFDRAMNKLSEGRGNLTITAEKVKKLGAKANKQIEQRYISDAVDDNQLQ